MKKYIYIISTTLLIAFVLGACATPHQSSPKTDKVQLKLDQAQKREANITNNYQVDSGDNFFTAKITGSNQPVLQSHEDYYQVSVPIGADINAECFVYHEAYDTAASLMRLFDGTLGEMQKTKIHNIDAGTFKDMPYLYQENMYLTKQNTIGVLKAISIPLDSSLLLCIHDTPGYRNTFKKMASSFARSVNIQHSAKENWQREEILVWTLRDMRVGFTSSRAVPDENGDIKNVIETALLIPRSEDEALTHDEYNLTWELPNGELLGGRYSEAENGELKVNITLNTNEQGAYHVSGLFQGKQIDSPLKTEESLDGPFHQQREMVRAAAPKNGQSKTLHINTYVPSLNPLETMELSAKPTGELVDGHPEYEMLFLGMKATSIVDDLGHKAMDLEMGPLNIQLSRAFINER